MEAPYEIWLQLAQRRRCFKMLMDDVRRTSMACLYYKLTSEPKGWSMQTDFEIDFSSTLSPFKNAPPFQGRILDHNG